MTGKTPTSTRKKRARTETSPDGDAGGRRGRPRVEKQDDSAVDRRRTQIRMAQRAYRQRKESTLEELRKRVSDLTNASELMNKSWLDYCMRSNANNLSPKQKTELETSTSSQFETLIKEVRRPDEDTPAAHNDANTSSAASTSMELEAADLVPQMRNVPSWLDQSAVSSEANRPSPPVHEIGMGYTLSGAEEGEGSLDLSNTSKDMELGRAFSIHHSNQPEELHFSGNFFDDDYDFFQMPPSQPSPPRTFSFQESTFAGRLHKMCLEQAYRLLLDSDTRPTTYERVFRLSLLGSSRAKIIDVIKIILARGPHQGLASSQAPLIHVGGAGTHYAPRDAFGNLLPKRQARNFGKIGPQALGLLDAAPRDQVYRDITVEISGYEGEWFDPGDVQGYLEEKGIFIDPSSTFAEAELSVDSTSGFSSASSNRGTLTPVSHATTKLETRLTQWEDLFSTDLTGVGFSDAQTGSWMNFLQPGELIKRSTSETASAQALSWSDNWSEQSLFPIDYLNRAQARKRKVVIDVRQLVKALVKSGICLGRSPGFRRKDVDRALASALVEPL